jgi:hypothetical protein
MKLRNKVALTTFMLFTAEALIHYNIGRNAHQESQESKKKIIPPFKEIIKMVMVVGVFSIINAIAIDYLAKK